MTEGIDYKAEALKYFGEWKPLYDRNDIDFDLVNMISPTTKLLDADKHEIPNSIRVPLNDIATFAWKVETALNAAIEQIEVSAESKRFDTSYVEGFIRDAFKEADKLLALEDMYPFDPFTDQQTFRRGSVASYCNFKIVDGELIATIVPRDTRYTTLENDSKGLLWIATKFFRSESKVLSLYPEAKGKTISTGDNELLYIIARDTSQIWLGDSKIKELPNKLGYVPAVYRKVPMGSMTYDKDTIQYQGESGLFLVRDIFSELERIASIIQSLNLKVVDQALQIERQEVNNAAPDKTVDELNAPGVVNPTPSGTRYELMPLGQLQQSYDRLYQILEDRMQRGMSSYYQNVLQPKTATEIMKISQEQGDVVMPRIGTRGMQKQDLAEMFIKQTIAECAKAKITQFKLGNRTIEVGKLKGDYQIEFKYHFTDPRLDAARQSLAISQKDSGLYSDMTIMQNTLQVDDVAGEMRQLAMEKARIENPLVAMDWEITKLLEAADDGDPYAEDAAMALAMVWIPAAKQAMQGLLTPNMQQNTKSSQPMVPLLPGGTQGGGQQNV